MPLTRGPIQEWGELMPMGHGVLAQRVIPDMNSHPKLRVARKTAGNAIWALTILKPKSTPNPSMALHFEKMSGS